MPVPMHMLVTNTLSPRLPRNAVARTTCRAAAMRPVNTIKNSMREWRRTATERVADDDRAAVDVHPLERNADPEDGVDDVARERFVDLVEVGVVVEFKL